MSAARTEEADLQQICTQVTESERRTGKMARRKNSTLGRDEFLFLGRKLQVVIPEINLCVLKNNHRDQKRIKVQACWATRFFRPYDAIIDSRVDCFALVNKPIAVKAAKYNVADIIPLAGWKNGVMIFTGLQTDGQEREDVPMLIADLGVECDMVLGRRWLEESHTQLDCSDMKLEPPSSASLSCDRIELPLGYQESVQQMNYKNMAFSPEAHEEELSARQEKTGQLLDELNEDACQSRILNTDDQCLQPLVRLPGRDESRLFPAKGSFSVRNPVAPMATSKKNLEAVNEDKVIKPTVRLPCYRHEEKSPDEGDIGLEDIPIIDVIVDASLSLVTNGHEENRKSEIDNFIVTMPFPETLEDLSACRDGSLPDDTTMLSHELQDKEDDFSPCQKELGGVSDELNDQDSSHVRLPETNHF